MPNVKRNDIQSKAEAKVWAEVNSAPLPPTFSIAIERLGAIRDRLEDQVKSLGHIGNCYLGSCPADEEKSRESALHADGSVNVITAQIADVEDLLSALEGKIDRFRGRH